MIRIRFHGRGGHGIKTASRIVGSAAFLAGNHAQDSPIYGAERRGAAIAAFTRIDRRPILERGVITNPTAIIVGDETLLADPAANVLVGQESASVVFVNAESAAGWAEQHKVAPPLVVLDVTARTLAALGRASALSAGLAAAAARLTGLSQGCLLAAVRDELEHLEVPEETVQQNLAVATDVFNVLQPVALRDVAAPAGDAMHRLGFDDPLRSTPSIFAAGNAEQRETGSWRVERPEIAYDRCTRCGICFVRCPDGAIALDEHGYPVIDYDHCKGCMICWDQCPVQGAVVKKKEVRSW